MTTDGLLVVAGEDSADLTVSGITAMNVSDGAGNTQSSTALPVSNLGDTSDIAIDTTAPAAPVVGGVSDDSGTSGTDGVTSDTTLVIYMGDNGFMFIDAMQNAIVRVSTDDGLVGYGELMPLPLDNRAAC